MKQNPIHSFSFRYFDSVVWDCLSDDQAGQLIKSIFKIYEIDRIQDPLVLHTFDMLKPNIKTKYKRDRLSPAEWNTVRTNTFLYDDFTCQYCGKKNCALECDHIFPIIKGGSHEYENLITACISCNRSKGNKTLSEWLGS